MIQLVYASIAVKPLDDAELAALRVQSSANNRRDEITGIMIARGERFLQALEGPQTTVENTFLRIVVDPRHHSLALLSRRAIGKREYGEWEMQLCESIADCPQAAEHFVPLLEKASDDIRRAFLDPVPGAPAAQAAASSASSP